MNTEQIEIANVAMPVEPKPHFIVVYDPETGAFNGTIQGTIPHDAMIAALERFKAKIIAAAEKSGQMQQQQEKATAIEVAGHMPMPKQKFRR